MQAENQLVASIKLKDIKQKDDKNKIKQSNVVKITMGNIKSQKDKIINGIQDITNQKIPTADEIVAIYGTSNCNIVRTKDNTIGLIYRFKNQLLQKTQMYYKEYKQIVDLQYNYQDNQSCLQAIHAQLPQLLHNQNIKKPILYDNLLRLCEDLGKILNQEQGNNKSEFEAKTQNIDPWKTSLDVFLQNNDWEVYECDQEKCGQLIDSFNKQDQSNFVRCKVKELWKQRNNNH